LKIQLKDLLLANNPVQLEGTVAAAVCGKAGQIFDANAR
jgi:hypothetical protein